MTDLIRTRLTRWKQLLIDQTLKNPLLNFRPTKVTTIGVVDERPVEVFRILQIEEKSMRFKTNDQLSSSEKMSPNEYDSAEFSTYDRGLLEQRHTDTELQTAISSEILDVNLLRIYQKSAAMSEEQGFSSLCLSLGMLEWFETDESKVPFKAPLVLLPVQLLRETAGSKFTVSATQDDPILNPAILERLRISYRISLPQLPDSYEDFDLQQIFSEVQQSIAEKKRWRVTEGIYLGFFAFHKFVMFKDLEAAEDAYLNHEIIQALCTGTSTLHDSSSGDLESGSLDKILKPETTFQVVDADSSQIEAMLAVKHGSNLVIEGPPGTGKSQTITNLIAESLAAGKSVLFVSEKRAALEVVYNRLYSAGLTDFCLELHSNKTSKKTVYEELRRVLDSVRPLDHKEDADLARLSTLRDCLNEYSEALNMPFGALSVPPYWAIGEIARLDKVPIVNADIPDLEAIDMETFDQLCRNLSLYSELLSKIGTVTEHPWNGSELLEITTIEEERLREQIQCLEEAMCRLRSGCDQLVEQIGASKVDTFGQAEILCEVAMSLVGSPGVTESLLMNEGWNSISQEIAELLERGERYSETVSQVGSWFKAELLEEDFGDVLNFYEQHTMHWYRYGSPDFWNRREYFRKFFQSNYKPTSNTQLLLNLHSALRCREDLLYIRAHDLAGVELFGDKWYGPNSDWKALKNFAQWIVNVRHFIIEQALTSRGIALAASGGIAKSRVVSSVQAIRTLIDESLSALEQVCITGKFDQAKYLNARVGVDYVIQWAQCLRENLHLLYEWCVVNSAKKTCMDQSTGAVFLRFIQQGENECLLMDSFKKCFLRRWLDVVYRERPVLAKFHTSKQEQLIKEFRGLDIKSLDLAKRRLRHNLFRIRDEQLKSSALEMQLRILQRQIRARSKVSLRRLFTEIPVVLKAIKPCFMMSPLSAVQFINSVNSDPFFDLIIFDEASQITTEDAVGSIIRGKQLVVVGDPKQLPPTNFFTAQLTEELSSNGDAKDKEYDELQIVDLESVLDECLANGFPKRGLKWHYRSRHESLITFSNRNFYENELLTFPSPDTGVGERGVIFNYIGGTYEGNGVNPIEAQAVVDAVCRHVKESPYLSLGVGTFNMKQQMLIQDELDRRRRNDPSIEFFFAKKGETEFFVKNLENIQGDDRDVIFLSMTYGRGADGQMRHFFGPINQPNGWRRLNVILTRAKLRMHVFSSMRAEDIDPTRCTSDGAKYLQEFLRFAETGIASFMHIDDRALIESPFEQAVYSELTQLGLRLVPQVGQAGYRIDFGVLDNDSPGRFLAGIECDGATYHRAATARDRDRLREQVLKDLGWKLVRIWSTDWNHNKDSQIKRVVDYIAEQKSSAHIQQIDSMYVGTKITDLPNETEEPPRVHSESQLINPQHSVVSDTLPKAREHALVPYEFTVIQNLGSGDAFYLAKDEVIRKVITTIVNQEAPIFIDDLKKQVAAFWNLGRVGNRISSRLEKIIRLMGRNNELVIKGKFIWKIGQVHVTPRERNANLFTIDSVCDEELESFVLYVLGDGVPRTKEEALIEVARVLGFARTGQKLAERIEGNIQRLLQESKLEPCSAGIRLGQELR